MSVPRGSAGTARQDDTSNAGMDDDERQARYFRFPKLLSGSMTNLLSGPDGLGDLISQAIAVRSGYGGHYLC
jgi:hypothetical protein